MYTRHIRLVSVIVLLLAATTCVQAERRLSFGVKGGLAFAKQSWSYSNNFAFDNKLKPGFSGGLIAEYKVTPRLSLRGDAFYIRKGFKSTYTALTYTGPGDVVTYRYHVDYAAINFLAQIHGPVGLYAQVGPRIDFRLSKSSDYSWPLLDSVETLSGKTIFGLTFGLGRQFRVLPEIRFLVEAQYFLDFGHVVKREDFGPAYSGTLESVRNQSFVLSVGLLL